MTDWTNEMGADEVGTPGISFSMPPPPTVGGWDVGGITFMVTRRPSWLNKLMCRWLLGWRWTD